MTHTKIKLLSEYQPSFTFLKVPARPGWHGNEQASLSDVSSGRSKLARITKISFQFPFKFPLCCLVIVEDHTWRGCYLQSVFARIVMTTGAHNTNPIRRGCRSCRRNILETFYRRRVNKKLFASASIRALFVLTSQSFG